MSKTFGELRAGDEVYIIKGCNAKIVKALVAEPSPTEEKETWLSLGGFLHSIPSELSLFFGTTDGDIYCNIDDAMRRMQDICAKALHDYREASGALNKLETKKKMI